MNVIVNANPIKTYITLNGEEASDFNFDAIQESDSVFPLAPTAHLMCRSTYKSANEDDMVRVCETDGFSTHTRTVCYIAPNFSHVPSKHDRALLDALLSHEAEWYPTSPLCTLIAYSDNHGTWCVECGNSVYTGENGGYVCANPGCCNYDSDNCPAWVKELHNVA